MSSLRGVVGMKPTGGRIPQIILADRYSTWVHHGPITRAVTDNALMLNVLAGPDPSDPTSLPTDDVDAALTRQSPADPSREPNQGASLGAGDHPGHPQHSTPLVSAGADHTIRLWDPITGTPGAIIPLGIPVHALLQQPPNPASNERTRRGATITVGLRTGILALDLHHDLFTPTTAQAYVPGQRGTQRAGTVRGTA